LGDRFKIMGFFSRYLIQNNNIHFSSIKFWIGGLLFFFLTQPTTHGQVIQTYSSRDFGSSASIFSITKDSRDILYFGTSSGVLEYDGSGFNLILLSNYGEAIAVEVDDNGKVFVGGNGEFGYLKSDNHGALAYHSLSQGLEEPFDEVWQIVFKENIVFFQTDAGIFKWNRKGLKFLDIQSCYIFVIGETLYGSQYDSGLGVIENDTFHLKWPYGLINQDVVFQVFPVDSDQIILATPSNGLFSFNPNLMGSDAIQPKRTSLDTYWREKGIYDGVTIEDGIFAFGTWEGGLVHC